MKKSVVFTIFSLLLFTWSGIGAAAAAPISKALPFTVESSFSAGSDTCVLDGHSNVVYYTDYVFSAKSGQFVAFSLNSSQFDCIAVLMDAQKNPIAWNDDKDLTSANSFIFYQFNSSGTYYLRASQALKKAGKYKLTAQYYPSQITLDKSLLSLARGSSYSLNLTTLPANSEKNIITWSSSNPAVASVDKNGKVTALKSGTSIITAKTAYGVSATCKVTVSVHVDALSLNPSSPDIYLGRTCQATPVFTPADATDKSLTWFSSNENIAEVSASGLIWGKATGTVTITATAHNGKKADLTLRVLPLKEGMTDIRRLAGRNRYQTATAISREGWTESSTVILANSMNYADALCGISLSGFYDAPILITAGKAALEADIQNQILALKAKNIIILGGTSAVSSNIETQLRQSYHVQRLSGANRYETSAVVASTLDGLANQKTDTAILVTGTGYADALSISPYSALKQYPILYANNSEPLRAGVREYLSGIKNIIIIGGEKAIPSAIVNELQALGISEENIQRISGANRYLTSLKIAEAFDALFGSDIMLSTGLNFPDALAGGPLAAKKGIPLLLVGHNNITAEMQRYIQAKKPSMAYILGGESVIPTRLIADVLDK